MKKRFNKKFLVVLFVILILIIGYFILSYTGNGWVSGTINNFSSNNEQLTINTDHVTGRLKRANSDYLGFVMTDSVIYMDKNENVLESKPSLEIGQEIKVYYEFVDGDYNVIKIQLQ